MKLKQKKVEERIDENLREWLSKNGWIDRSMKVKMLKSAKNNERELHNGRTRTTADFGNLKL